MRIPSGDLAPARRRRRRHPYGRRRRTGPLLLALVLLAAVGGGAFLLQRDDEPGGASLAQAGCPSPRVGAAAAGAARLVAAPLPAPGQVRLALLNGTNRNGLGRTVGGALAVRGFAVAATGNAPGPVAGPAQVRFGPNGRPGATLLAAHVLGAQLRPVPGLPPGTVQLYLGTSFVRLRTPAEVTAYVKALNAPKAKPTPKPAPSAKAPAPQPCR